LSDAPATRAVVTLAELATTASSRGTRFASVAAKLGPLLGMEHLGARWMTVPPGRTAYPRHSHHNNEELFVILEGEGVFEIGDARHPVRAGDVAFAPAGGPETAHQLHAGGNSPLRYLCISTMRHPDITEYPDSGKFMVLAGRAFGGDPAQERFLHIGRRADQVDYWDGEDRDGDEASVSPPSSDAASTDDSRSHR